MHNMTLKKRYRSLLSATVKQNVNFIVKDIKRA